MHQTKEPITLRSLSEHRLREIQHQWWDRWQGDLSRWEKLTLSQACGWLYKKLSAESRGHSGKSPDVPLCSHAPDSYLSDHALLTSAVAFCLAHEDEDLTEQDRLLLRLAALSHELPHPEAEEPDTPDLRAQLRDMLAEPAERAFLDGAWQLLDGQAALLEASAAAGDSLSGFAGQRPETIDRRLGLLWYAHLEASQPLFNHELNMPGDEPPLQVIQKRSDFGSHPLKDAPMGEMRIGLVHGGASKIKDYVFESAKLPEIRGASALLDRLNLQDTRALFGEVIEYRDTVSAMIEAPECVIYANGGDVLALAPASKAQKLADAIERQYIAETLTAQCVAVAGVYSLLELQYGLRPDEFWCDDYLRQLGQADEHDQRLLRSYYGDSQHDNGKLDDERLFYMRRSFGELTTALALKRFWRREGNEGSWSEHSATTARSLAHFETLPFGQRCSSCDRRIAVQVEPTTGDVLCEPCLRKRCVGWLTRSIRRDCGAFLSEITGWQPGDFNPWIEVFREHLERYADLEAHYLRDHQDSRWGEIDSPADLNQLGQAARPRRFIGLIYADGNNVGALIERIRTAGFYRQFASRLFEATQAAVFTALATHLQPTWVTDEDGKDLLIHPFEIVSIGGDDLILIVPADKALDITLDIASSLEEVFHNGRSDYQKDAAAVQRYDKDSFQADGRPQISLSAGVVLAQENNPIFFLNDIVQELLKSAKDKAKRLKKHYAGGTVDFMALKSVTMVTSRVSEFRGTALREVKTPIRGSGCEVLHITARPYTLHELRGLLRTAAALQEADFPRSQLFHLRQELPKGRSLSSLSYLYFTSRLTPLHSALVQRTLDRSWHETSDPIPWRKRPTKSSGQKQPVAHEWESVLADIVEIYDFLPRPE